MFFTFQSLYFNYLIFYVQMQTGHLVLGSIIAYGRLYLNILNCVVKLRVPPPILN